MDSIGEADTLEVYGGDPESSVTPDPLYQYDGFYQLRTESEGATGTLKLQYLGDKRYWFELSLTVSDLCEGTLRDTLLVDRSQHAFFSGAGCLLNFNLSETEVEVEEPEGCAFMSGDCTFAATYDRTESGLTD